MSYDDILSSLEDAQQALRDAMNEAERARDQADEQSDLLQYAAANGVTDEDRLYVLLELAAQVQTWAATGDGGALWTYYLDNHEVLDDIIRKGNE